MRKMRCTLCLGRDGNFSMTCPDCHGSGYDRSDDKPFGQCHRCYGEGDVEVDQCPLCLGSGFQPRDI